MIKADAHHLPLDADVPHDVVTIDATSAFLCILGEHLHLNDRFGKSQWQPYRVTTHEIAARIYDRYDLWFESEGEKTIWFDITAAVGRWALGKR